MRLTRAAAPRLRPFIRSFWVSDRTSSPAPLTSRRENVLPTGDMHLVFRLSDDPVRLFTPDTANPKLVAGHAVVGGPRAAYYTKDITKPALAVGVQLKAGAAEALFCASADEFAGRHVGLTDLWGRSATLARDRILEARNPEGQLDVLETILSERLPEIRAMHPAVAGALEYFGTSFSICEAVRRSGYSHRGFVALFRRTVGLAPKAYTRVLRFQRVLSQCAKGDVRGAASWVDLAMRAGYSDQSHFIREFREFAGVTPEYYRRVAPEASHHVVTDLPSS